MDGEMKGFSEFFSFDVTKSSKENKSAESNELRLCKTALKELVTCEAHQVRPPSKQWGDANNKLWRQQSVFFAEIFKHYSQNWRKTHFHKPKTLQWSLQPLNDLLYADWLCRIKVH